VSGGAPGPTRPTWSRWACVLAGLLGAGMLVAVSGRPWVTRVLTDVPGVPRVSASGGSSVPVVPALALVAAAAAIALLVTGRLGRHLAAAVLLLAGLAAAGAVLSVLATPADAVAGAVTAASGRSGGVAGPPAGVTAWVWPALAAAALVAAGGATGLLRARTWPVPGRRFESAGATARATDGPATTGGGRQAGQVRGQGEAIGAWDALSRGEDPTR
jgi:uncharacterized membrane protein (TIGR02234 family)